MSSIKKLLETLEKLIELRKTAREVEDESMGLLRDDHNLVTSISAGLDVVNATGNGRESVRPLIEFKNIASEVCVDLETISIEDSIFTKDTNLEPACQKIKEDIKGDTGNTELRSYDDLTATRQEKEDEYSRLLLEAHNIASSMGMNLEDIGSQLFGDTIYIKYQFPFKDRLNICIESAHLIELENILAQMFANIERDELEMKSFINRKDQFIKQLNSTEEIIANLQTRRVTVRTESPVSVIRNVEANRTAYLHTPRTWRQRGNHNYPSATLTHSYLHSCVFIVYICLLSMYMYYFFYYIFIYIHIKV